MRILFTSLEIVSRRVLERRLEEAMAERAADLMKRYSQNTDCLRAAVTAHGNFYSTRFVAPDSMLIAPMSRAIVGFVDELKRQSPTLGAPAKIRANA